jgi:hypothetical protein
MNTNFNLSSDDQWKKSVKKILKEIGKDIENIVIDKKRNVNESEKLFIWNKSIDHPNLDPKSFRIDVLGNVIIKNIKYTKINNNKVFAGEYEHIQSHSFGGRSNTENVCLLNAGINRSKSNKQLFKLNYNEVNGSCRIHGMTANVLLEKLDYQLHATCSYYNLHFQQLNGIWTVSNGYNNEVKNARTARKNNEKSQKRQIEENRNYKEKETNIQVAVVVLVITTIINNRVEIYNGVSYAWNSSYNFFFGETKEEINLIKN